MTVEIGAANGVLHVLAVDDEQPALDELAYLLRDQPRIGELYCAVDATTALRSLRAHRIDAVFLDINMPGLTGMELAGILAEFAHPPSVVFVTAHEDHAVAAFDLGAVDYLLKPLRRERLAEAVRRLGAANSAVRSVEGDTIPVDHDGATTLVHRSSVHWVEADGDYARLHTDAGSYLVRIPLSALVARWADAGFLRVHRSYLVALRLVTGLRTVDGTTTVCIQAGPREAVVELPVSRRHVRELKERLVHRPRQQWNQR